MSKPTHSPGPWRTYDIHAGGYAEVFGPKSGNDDEIDRVTLGSQADANLISAAPEMLEVLMKFMDFKDSEYVPNEMFNRAAEVIRKASQ